MSDLPALPADLATDIPAFANELDEAILAAVLAGHDQEPGYEPDGDDRLGQTVVAARAWFPTTIGEADWAMRKLAAARAREDEIEGEARGMMDRITAWADGERRRIDPAITFFESRLKMFGLARRIQDPRDGKSTRLPSGTVSTKAGPGPKVVVQDEAAFLEWAEGLSGDEYAAAVKTVKSPKLTGIRDMVAIGTAEGVRDASGEVTVARVPVYPPTGEVVPGLAVAGEQPMTVTVKPS